MNKTIKNKEAAGKAGDWAIIPFDEAEDDARWTKLIEETDELINEAENISNYYGVSLRRSRLGDLVQTEAEAEDPLF